MAFSLDLVLVEQRHDLPDHVAHGIVADLLGDGHQPDAGLGEATDVELKLELVAEEADESVDQDHIERRRLVVAASIMRWNPAFGHRWRTTGIDVVGDDLPAVRRAIALRLAALVQDGKIADGLSGRGAGRK